MDFQRCNIWTWFCFLTLQNSLCDTLGVFLFANRNFKKKGELGEDRDLIYVKKESRICDL